MRSFQLSILAAVSVGLSACGSSQGTFQKADTSKEVVLPTSHPASPNFFEGKIVSTVRALDLTIRGAGFFVVKSPEGKLAYTRAGSFIKDTAGTGNLSTRNGFYLQGFAIREDGEIASELSNILVSPMTTSSLPKKTTQLYYSFNLDATTSVRTDSFNPAEAVMTSDFNVSHSLYDEAGEAHTATLSFRKKALNSWSFHLVSDAGNLLQEGTLDFDSNGRLVNVTGNLNPYALSFGPLNDASGRVTQYSGEMMVSDITQNGRSAGELNSFEITKSGRINGSFSNGTTQDLYQIPLAFFSNGEGLKPVDGAEHVYEETGLSGSPMIAPAYVNGRGWIKSFSLAEKYIPSVPLPDFTQGAFKSSSRATDLAIQGSGLFIVRESTDGDMYFTRDGELERDWKGQLVLAKGGHVLQGYSISETGAMSGVLSNIVLDASSSAPSATTFLHLQVNLNPDVSALSEAFDLSTHFAATNTSHYHVPMTIYDSLGTARLVTTYFRREGSNYWEFYLATEGQNLASHQGRGLVVLSQGILTFKSSGQLEAVTSTGDLPQINWRGGASPAAALTLNFGQLPKSAFSTTQYAGYFSTTSIDQNGRAAGTLSAISIESDGRIEGVFTNNSKRDLYVIPLASFINDEGLEPVEDTKHLFKPTIASGEPVIGKAESAGRGTIRAYNLEVKEW